MRRLTLFAVLLSACFALILPASALAASPPKLKISKPSANSTWDSSFSVKVKMNKKSGKVSLKISIDGDVRSKPSFNGTEITKKLDLSHFGNGKHKLSVTSSLKWNGKKYTPKASLSFYVSHPAPPGPPADAGPPTAPSNLTVSAVSRRGVLLEWSGSTDDKGVVVYDVYRSDGTVLIGTTSQVYLPAGGLNCGTQYGFNVVARDTAGKVSSSPVVPAITRACPDSQGPTQPNNLSASNVTETSTHLTWSSATDNVGVVRYLIYYGSYVVGQTSGLHFDLLGMKCGTDEDIAVAALDGAGNVGPQDSIVVGTDSCVDSTPPGSPTGLSADQQTHRSLRLSWNNASDNVAVTGYDVFVNNVRVKRNVSSPQTLDPLLCEHSYALTVVARDASGNVGVSAPLNVNQPTCPTPSGEPMPGSDIPDWNLIFTDDFTVDAPTGSMGSETDAGKIIYTGAGGSKWVTYPETFKDTYQKRPYRSDEVLSVHDGTMDFFLHNVDGQPAGANPSPLIDGSSQYQTYGRYSARVFVQPTDLSEYYMAWLLWPWDEWNWESAESDYPEGSLYPGKFGVGGFHHFGHGQQEIFSDESIDMHEWHTYTQEWRPGQRKYYVDDRLIHTSSVPVYSGPERWQLQTETNGNGTHAGHVLVDWVAVYSYDP
jgi:chitodextrinase